jgi:hypothetical protein
MDEFAYRSWVQGWELSKVIWTVPEAFGAAQFVKFLLVPNHGPESIFADIGPANQQD